MNIAKGLNNLQATIDRSTHLVQRLLSLARLQNETLPKDNVDLCECVREVVDEVALYASYKEQTLDVQIPEHFYILGHADSLAIMIRNFLDNAIKYTPPQGHISVSVTADGTLRITDTGPGIRDDQKVRAFERFTRLDKTGEPGSGLGLSIAQWVADAHYARIDLKNNAPHGLIVEVTWQAELG